MTASQVYRKARIEGHSQQNFATVMTFGRLHNRYGRANVARHRFAIQNALANLEAQLQQGTCKVAQEAQE